MHYREIPLLNPNSSFAQESNCIISIILSCSALTTEYTFPSSGQGEMAAVTHVWHLRHSTWKPFPLETCKTLAYSFFCFLTTSLASSYVTLCLKMLKGMLSWHNIHTIYFLLTEECYSKGLQLSVKHSSNLNRFMFPLVAWDTLQNSMSVPRNSFHPWQRHLHGLDTILPLHLRVALRCPRNWLKEHRKLCIIFWEVSWSALSPAGHFVAAHPVLRCYCLGDSLEILWISLTE